MLERYRRMIEGAGGVVHREEDWGRRQLAHPITKIHKAHYLMLNVECPQDTLDELVGAFRFSDAVLRHLVISRDKAITETSPMAKEQEEEKAKEAQSAAAEAARPRAPKPAPVTDESSGEDGDDSADDDADEADDVAETDDADETDDAAEIEEK
jgi:small subunit ribosomal protein S6